MKLAQTFSHLLFPGSTNNHRGKVLHNTSVIVIGLLFVLSQISISFLNRSFPSILGYAAQISADEVIRLTNEKRTNAGLPHLQHNPTLSQAAQAKAADMINKDYWAHVAPDGTEPWKFFLDFGYKYRYAGENLARDFSSAASAVDAWMASPTHKDNILSANYDQIGIAVIEGDMGGADTTIIVQFFGKQMVDTPLEAAPVAQALPTAAPAAISSPRPQPSTAPSFLNVETVASETLEEVAVVPEPASDNPALSEPSRVLISPFSVTKSTSLAMIGFLLVAMTADAVIISRKKLTRITGRSAAHLAFFIMLFAVVLVAKAGEIM